MEFDKNISKNYNKRNKGKSLILFPNEFIIIDIETTGLCSDYDDIIEISALKIKDNIVIDSFSSLVKPQDEISEFITKLTGITNEMLENAPNISDVLLLFKNFISNDILLGYNVNFDINFLFDFYLRKLNVELKNDYMDILRLVRANLNKDETYNFKLKNVAKYFNIDVSGIHRGLKDCEVCFEVYKNIQGIILKKYNSLDEYAENQKKDYTIHISDIVAKTNIFDFSHPCYDREFVFTGTLEKMARKDAMQIVVNLGGKVGNSVTKKTNFLVMGNLDYRVTTTTEKSSKIIKAENLKLKGQDIEIIPENVFYDMIEN